MPVASIIGACQIALKRCKREIHPPALSGFYCQKNNEDIASHRGAKLLRLSPPPGQLARAVLNRYVCPVTQPRLVRIQARRASE